MKLKMKLKTIKLLTLKQKIRKMVNLKVKKSVVLGWERKIDLVAQNETVHI